MALQNNKMKKPVVFGRKKSKTPEGKEQDDTLDMLLHYAKAGMEYAEQSLKETPELFSQEEREAFMQNKNMLEQAPFLIETYKTKISEHDALHKKMLGILKTCEDIVASGDQQAKEEIKGVLQQTSVFSYDDNGDLVVKKS